jgi:hypothetical protein
MYAGRGFERLFGITVELTLLFIGTSFVINFIQGFILYDVYPFSTIFYFAI